MLALQFTRNKSLNKAPVITFLSRATLWAIVSAAFSFVLLCMAGWWFSYDDIMAWFNHHSRLYFETSTEGDAFLFSYAQYQMSRYVSLVLFGIVIGIFIVVRRCYHTYIAWFTTFYQSLGLLAREYIRTVRSFERWKTLGFVIIFLSAIVYQLFHYHRFIIFADDLCSYYCFAKNIIVASIFYPIPNNHIFYNQLSHLLSYFIDDPLLSTRLPSLISFVLLGLLLFGFQLKFFKDQRVAFLGLALVMFLLPSSIYASQGRGYMLQNLFIVFSTVMMILGLLNKQYEYFIGFIIASILGAYIVPTFFIPFLANVIFGITIGLLQKDKKGIRCMVGSCFLTGIGVILCYMPVFLFSGIASITENKFVDPSYGADFYTRIYPIAVAEFLSFFSGTYTKGWLFFLIFIGLSIPAFRNSSENVRYWLLLTFIHITVIFSYMLLTKSVIPFRSTTYFCFFLYISFSVVAVYWLHRIIFYPFAHRFGFSILFVLILFISYRQYQHNIFLSPLFPSYDTRQLADYTDKIFSENISVYIDKQQTYFTFYFQYRMIKDGRLDFTLSDPENADLLFLNKPFVHQDFSEKFHTKGKLANVLNHLYIYERIKGSKRALPQWILPQWN